MNIRNTLKFALGFALVMSSGLAHAVSLRAYCYQPDKDGQSIAGVNTEQRLEMGSVSKVFTTFWALSTLGPAWRFETRVYISPVSAKDWDVHIAGSMDPSFGRENLQLVMARLNQVGVRSIRRLTFDSNFKFVEDPTSDDVAIAFLHTYDPKPATVQYHLSSVLSTLTLRYHELQQQMNQYFDQGLPKTVVMKIGSVDTLESIPFAVDGPQVQVFSYHSIPILSLLKEMNRNSNNFYANLIFESLGGREAFKDFFKSLNLSEQDARMFNGSGDRFDEDLKGVTYDSATCQTILQVLHNLRAVLKKNGGLLLQDALAVVGEEDGGATVDVYENDWTTDAVVAKTGTVDPTVALAGVANTKNGPLFFASMYGSADTADRASTGRVGIRDMLTKWIRSQGGADKLHYKKKLFFPLDKDSDLVKLNPEEHLDLHKN